MKNNRKNGICYLCGKKGASTKDHIPPKCIFPESLRSKNIRKITLWACHNCNNKMGKIDEKVRDYLSLCIFTNFREEVWEKTRRKLMKSNRLRNKMIKNMIPVYSANIPLRYIKNGATYAIKLPKSFDDFIKRLFKGFHTHYTDTIINDKYDILIFQYPQDQAEKFMKYINCYYIINDVLSLRGSISKDKTKSMWWLQFYDNPFYVSIIAPKEFLKYNPIKIKSKQSKK